MEAQWIADRAALRCLSRQHPDWTHEELAVCVGRSRSFVKKWLKRFREAAPDDLTVLHSRSCARKTPRASEFTRFTVKACRAVIVKLLAVVRKNVSFALQHFSPL